MSNRRRRNKSTMSKSLRKEIKKIVSAQVDEEVEDKAYVMGAENQQLYHNKPFYVGKLLQAIQQGIEDGDQGTGISGNPKCRLGDQIELKNVNIRLWLSNKLDRPNVMYKGVLFWYPVDQVPDRS